MQYQFTPLELLLASVVLSFLSALGVRLVMGRQFVTRAEFERLEKTMDVFTRMVRSLVVYSDEIPEQEKAKILNGRD
jgi:hypothetical protein